MVSCVITSCSIVEGVAAAWEPFRSRQRSAAQHSARRTAAQRGALTDLVLPLPSQRLLLRAGVEKRAVGEVSTGGLLLGGPASMIRRG